MNALGRAFVLVVAVALAGCVERSAPRATAPPDTRAADEAAIREGIGGMMKVAVDAPVSDPPAGAAHPAEAEEPVARPAGAKWATPARAVPEPRRRC